MMLMCACVCFWLGFVHLRGCGSTPQTFFLSDHWHVIVNVGGQSEGHEKAIMFHCSLNAILLTSAFIKL